MRQSALILVVTTMLSVLSVRARADTPVPAPTRLPDQLSLDAALEIFRQRGLDLLIADAAIAGAEGDVKAAGAVPNPVVSANVGNAFTYANTSFGRADCLRNGASCSPWSYSVGLSESGAIFDVVSGKRNLRLRVSRYALGAAKLSRQDAERVIALQVKSSYLQIAQAVVTRKFAAEIAAAEKTTLKKFRDRYEAGAINEGDLQRIEVEKLEADQVADTAEQNVRAARVALAFLLGVRGSVPDFEVDTSVLDFAEPTALHDASETSLLRAAFEHRPDLVSLSYAKASADAQIKLVERQKLPELQFNVSYAGGGFGGLSTNGPLQGQVLSLGISAPLPLFYQLEGEERQAHAQRDANALREAQVTAEVAQDVATSFAAYASAKRLVERMEGPRREDGGLLQSAKGAFEIVAVQYEKGAANLTDYLDALRSYIATKNEYIGDLAAYWTAVYQLEAAVAKDMR